jgi:ABC-type Fe3+/spermidine/putrescine transport system ATPase subunit
VYAAVDDLADYSQKLGAIAIVLTHRQGEAAATFSRLAAAAEARMALLGSP